MIGLNLERTSAYESKNLRIQLGRIYDPELIKKFEKETGIQVVYETFDSNEAMEAKIRNGGTRYPVLFLVNIQFKN